MRVYSCRETEDYSTAAISGACLLFCTGTAGAWLRSGAHWRTAKHPGIELSVTAIIMILAAVRTFDI